MRMRDTYLKVSFGFEIWRAADIAAAAGPAAAASADDVFKSGQISHDFCLSHRSDGIADGWHLPTYLPTYLRQQQLLLLSLFTFLRKAVRSFVRSSPSFLLLK